jgi:hypothetical protein
MTEQDGSRSRLARRPSWSLTTSMRVHDTACTSMRLVSVNYARNDAPWEREKSPEAVAIGGLACSA